MTEITLALRRAATLTDRLGGRHLAPGRAVLTLDRESAPLLTVHLALPEPSTDPDWITRLLLARLEAQLRGSAGGEEEARITSLALTLDRLTNPAARQLPPSSRRPAGGRSSAGRWSGSAPGSATAACGGRSWTGPPRRCPSARRGWSRSVTEAGTQP